MLNEAQQRNLRIVLCLIEEAMRAIERRLTRPEERGLMFEVRNDLAPDAVRALRQKLPDVYAIIEGLRDRFALPGEIRYAGREVLKGLPQFWVMLQESDSKGLRRYGDVDPALGPVLDPRINRLARLMIEMEALAMGNTEAGRAPASAEENPNPRPY